MRDFNAFIQACDADIRGGRVRETRRRLMDMNMAAFPRPYRLAIANICRRVGLYSRGLTALRRVIHPSKNRKDQATPQELAEYGVLLLRSGAVPEALAMLSRIDASEVPEALLYRSFGHFTRWEFLEALPLLDRYLGCPLSPYAALLGRTNLAYAYAYLAWKSEYFERALEVCKENIGRAREGGHSQLERSCRAILAHAYIQKSELALAGQELAAARERIALEDTNDHFLVTKWSLILDGLREKNMASFAAVREAAIKNREWEALREADFYTLQVKFDLTRYLHLYFGSPYEQFREHCRHAFAVGEAREFYVLGPKKAPRFDLSTGEIEGTSALNPGKQCHQLIEILLRDFYQPLSVTGLFSALFPSEHFDVSVSPGRVHQSIRRTRQWLTNHQLPLEIAEDDGFYSLRILGDFSFRIPRTRHSVTSNRVHFEKLKALLADCPSFCAQDVQATLKLPKTTIYRLIGQWVENGLLRPDGDRDGSKTFSLKAS